MGEPLTDPIKHESVPTLGPLGMGLLAGGLAAAGGILLYRRGKGKKEIPGEPSSGPTDKKPER